MNICIWLGASFEKNYASYHLMRDVILELYKRDHDIWVVQPQNADGNIPEELKKKNIHIINVKKSDPQKKNFVGRYLSAIGYYLKCISRINNIGKIDVAFVQSNISAYIPSKVLSCRKIPFVYNVQDTYPYNAVYTGTLKESDLIFKVLRYFQNKTYDYANKVITISEDMKEFILEEGVPSSKLEVVYNWGYRDSIYDAQKDLRSEIAELFDRNYFNVVYAGNIGMLQNVEIIVEAAKEIRNERIWFHIFGEGVRKDKLKEYARNSGVNNISFWPKQKPELAPSIYMSADINVIPLLEGVYKTALPSKTATVVACRKPLILCIGKDSIFAQRMENETGCPNVGCNDVKSLVQEIESIYNKNTRINTDDFYRKTFLRSTNSAKYAEIIEKISLSE